MVTSGCVAILAPGEPTRTQAEVLVRAALAGIGETPWRSMSIDLYPGHTGSLVIARPTSVVTAIYIDERAMEWMTERFRKNDAASPG